MRVDDVAGNICQALPISATGIAPPERRRAAGAPRETAASVSACSFCPFGPPVCSHNEGGQRSDTTSVRVFLVWRRVDGAERRATRCTRWKGGGAPECVNDARVSTGSRRCRGVPGRASTATQAGAQVSGEVGEAGGWTHLGAGSGGSERSDTLHAVDGLGRASQCQRRERTAAAASGHTTGRRPRRPEGDEGSEPQDDTGNTRYILLRPLSARGGTAWGGGLVGSGGRRTWGTAVGWRWGPKATRCAPLSCWSVRS
jgi:hypothetical protein